MHTGKLPSGPLRQTIENRSETFTVTRPSRSVSDTGVTSEGTSTHEEDIHVFDPNANQIQQPYGEVRDADLAGLALPNADLEDEDRITHGNYTYEMTINEVPNSANTRFLQIELERSDQT